MHTIRHGLWVMLFFLAAIAAGCHTPETAAQGSVPEFTTSASLSQNDTRRLQILAENFLQAAYIGNREAMSSMSDGDLRKRVLAGQVPDKKDLGYYLDRIHSIHVVPFGDDHLEINLLVSGGRAGQRSQEYVETLTVQQAASGDWHVIEYERHLP